MKFCWYTRKTRTFSKETRESHFILYSYCITVGRGEVPADSVNVCHSSGLITSIRLQSHHISHSLCRGESPVSHTQTRIVYVWSDSGRCVEIILKVEDFTIICVCRESSYVQRMACFLKRVHVIQYEMPSGSNCSHISTACWQHNKGLQEFVINVVKLWRIFVW